MDEFIFGTLATTEKRAAHLRERQQGVQHEPLLHPLAPQAGVSPLLTVTVELDRPVEKINCVLIEPEQVVLPLQLVITDWDVLNWSYYQRWQVKLPARPDGTVVRYRIEAYPATEPGPILANDKTKFSYFVNDPSQPE